MEICCAWQGSLRLGFHLSIFFAEHGQFMFETWKCKAHTMYISSCRAKYAMCKNPVILTSLHLVSLREISVTTLTSSGRCSETRFWCSRTRRKDWVPRRYIAQVIGLFHLGLQAGLSTTLGPMEEHRHQSLTHQNGRSQNLFY